MDFDTLLYTCAAEFDFMEKEVRWDLSFSRFWSVHFSKGAPVVQILTSVLLSQFEGKENLAA